MLSPPPVYLSLSLNLLFVLLVLPNLGPSSWLRVILDCKQLVRKVVLRREMESGQHVTADSGANLLAGIFGGTADSGRLREG